jgi:glycerate dehydrogenase
MPVKIVVLDGYCLNPGDLSWDALRGFGELTVHDRTPAADVVSRAAAATMVLTNKTPLPREVLAQLADLKYIGVLATGYNIVDVEAACERGIVVSNVPTYGTASVAQFVFALLLELCHNVAMHAHAVRSGQWARSKDWSFWKAPLVELAGKTIGIVGFGRIGRQVARIADAMGMRVIANDTYQANDPPYDGFSWAPLEDLLRDSDVVSLHSPLFPETRGMINAATIALMKPTAFLINTSRGPLIVDRDLAEALNSGRIAGAALDVLSAEPPAADNPLLSARNCMVTPHIAWATREARSRLMDVVVENIAAFLAGKPQNLVG